ncbi:hypothetical protein HYX13_00795, partial [Candidatus Woesearchaeota archaeon]|nr:hypothetical protein [Candidatus Woesearchaeota archaeon]
LEKKEKTVKIPGLQQNDPAFEKEPFYVLGFQDASGRPCKFAGFEKKKVINENQEVVREKKEYAVTFVMNPGLRYFIDCSEKKTIPPALGGSYSVINFQDLGENNCVLLFKERR